ncbi:MAG: CBS domain-containing protein [Candidatus Anstonellaceae archaeon]
MKVRDIMRTDFVSFTSDSRLEEVVKAFAEKKINSAPVFEGKEFMGIVSDFGMIKYFTPKEFGFLWLKSKPVAIEQVKNVTAGELAKKPRLVLSPEMPLVGALPKIALASECIPVMEKGKFVGLMRGEDVTEFFLKMLAADHYQQQAASGTDAQAEAQGNRGIGSTMDDILAVVRRDKEVSCEKIAKELGLSLKTTEKLCESLSRHGLIELRNSFVSGTVARVTRNEKS